MATTYGFLPPQAAPQLYISEIPQYDLQRGEDIRKKIEDKTNEIIGQRYKEVGTPDQINKYQLQGRATEAANYLSSLPIADKEQLANSGGVDPWATARSTWTGVTQNAQEDYVKAINEARQPSSTTSSTTQAVSPITRLFNKRTGQHLYSSNVAAEDTKNPDWSVEGPAFNMLGTGDTTAGATDVTRLRGQSGDYLLSADPEEIKAAQSQGYTAEGVLGKAFKTAGKGTKQIQRYRNVNTGEHFYTASPETEHPDFSKYYAREAGGDFWVPDSSSFTPASSTASSSSSTQTPFKLPSTASEDQQKYLDALAKKQNTTQSTTV
jgi:hypothetical protein